MLGEKGADKAPRPPPPSLRKKNSGAEAEQEEEKRKEAEEQAGQRGRTPKKNGLEHVDGEEKRWSMTWGHWLS